MIRLLWQGGEQSHRGRYFTVEQARLYTLPDEPPPLFVAADGEKSVGDGRSAGDGLIGVAPEAELIEQFAAAGGRRKPRYGQVTVCYAGREAEARQIAHEWWPNAGLQGNLTLGDQDAVAVRARGEVGAARTTSPNRSSAGPIASAISRPSGGSSTPATITSTSIRSDPIRRGSFASTRSASCPSCADPLTARTESKS